MHRGCFVWTPKPPSSGRRTPRPDPARVCVCMPCLARSGGPASRAPSGAPHLSFGRSWCALCLFGPLRAGVAPFVVVVGFFSFPSPPSLRPLFVLLCVFSGLGCLGPWRLAASPPPFFFPPPPSLRPRCLTLCVVSVLGCLGPWRLVAPPPPPVVCGIPGLRPRVPWASAPCPPPAFFSFVSCFFFFRFFPLLFLPVVRCEAGLCVLGRRLCPCVPRWCCPGRCSGCAGWCCVVLAVGPGCPLLSPGGPWCRVSVVLSLSGRVARRPVVWRGVSWCSAALCGVLLRCAVVWWCAVVLCRLFGSLPVSVVCFLPLRVSCVCSVCVLGCRAVCSLASPPCAVPCCAMLVPFRCAVRVVCAVSGGWCCWFLVSLPFVGGLLVALVARRCRLVVCVGFGARVESGRRSASSLWSPAPLCCVLRRCAAVWCCAVVPCLLFLFFSLLVALVSCCSLLTLGSGPVPGCFCFWTPPVRCCAGVPASLLSVWCSLALAGLAGVLCCCLLCSCVCCWAWLSSVVCWWVLLAPGLVSGWRAVVCPWVLCCAVLLRVEPPGVALLCAVLFPFAPFGAAARCVVSWGAVHRLGVRCLLAPCFVLPPRAVCVLLWCVAAWCCSPLCFVPCAPWGVVLCVSCRLRPVRCCCVARSPSVSCSPVLCPVVLGRRVVPWCPVLPPCWVCFLRGCGCTYLKTCCKIC